MHIQIVEQIAVFYGDLAFVMGIYDLTMDCNGCRSRDSRPQWQICAEFAISTEGEVEVFEVYQKRHESPTTQSHESTTIDGVKCAWESAGGANKKLQILGKYFCFGFE